MQESLLKILSNVHMTICRKYRPDTVNRKYQKIGNFCSNKHVFNIHVHVVLSFGQTINYNSSNF